MRKKSLFVSVLLVICLCAFSLWGCAPGETTPQTNENGENNNNTTQTAEYDAQALLEALKKDFAFTAEVNYTVTTPGSDPETETFSANTETFVGAEEYYLNIIENGVSTDTVQYFKSDEGKIVEKTVDKTNTVIETESTQFQSQTYDEVFVNPFKYVETSDFTRTDKTVKIDVSGALGESTVGETLGFLITMMPLPLSEITVTLNDEYQPVSFAASLNDVEGETTIDYSIEAVFTDKNTLDIPVYPYPASGDKTLLTAAFTALKNNNFTFDLYSSAYAEGENHVAHAVVTPDATLYNDLKQNTNVGFVKDPVNGYLAEVVASAGKLNGTANYWEDMTLADDKFPSYDFSVDLFRIEDDAFVLRKGSYDLAELLPDSMSNLSYVYARSETVKFTVASDVSEITYSYDMYFLGRTNTVTVVITEIGTTQLGYDLETDYVPYSPFASSWSGVNADGNGINGFNEMFPAGNMDEDIPFYNTEDGEFTYFGSFSDQFEIEITYASESDASFDIDSYGRDIVGFGDTGWNLYSSENDRYVYVNEGKGYMLTVYGGADLLGNGYVVYIYIAPWPAA